MTRFCGVLSRRTSSRHRKAYASTSCAPSSQACKQVPSCRSIGFSPLAWQRSRQAPTFCAPPWRGRLACCLQDSQSSWVSRTAHGRSSLITPRSRQAERQLAANRPEWGLTLRWSGTSTGMALGSSAQTLGLGGRRPARRLQPARRALRLARCDRMRMPSTTSVMPARISRPPNAHPKTPPNGMPASKSERSGLAKS